MRVGTLVERVRRGLRSRCRTLLRRSLGVVSSPVLVEALAAENGDGTVRDAELALRSRRPVAAIDLVTGYLDNSYVLGGYDADGKPRFEWRTTTERAVITETTARLPSDVRRRLRRDEFDVRFDVDLRGVLEGCREGRESWLTDELIALYLELGEMGFMSDVAVYRVGTLVGGYVGISVGGCFAGLSRFHREPGAGTVAYGALVAALIEGTGPTMIDSGPMSDHVARFGAVIRDGEDHRRAVLAGLAGPVGRLDFDRRR